MQLEIHVRQFLEERRFAVAATINPDGTPQQTVMWYYLDGDEIVMNTAAGRQKPLNLRRDPRLSFCVESDYSYVTITGTAELVEDQEIAQADIRRLAIRYDGPEEGARQAAEQFSRQHRITIRMKVEHVIAHDIEAE
jgi:PPOX class probable F420-dependent enzyme